MRRALEPLPGVEKDTIEIDPDESRQFLITRFRVGAPAAFDLEQALGKIRAQGYVIPQVRQGSGFAIQRTNHENTKERKHEEEKRH